MKNKNIERCNTLLKVINRIINKKISNMKVNIKKKAIIVNVNADNTVNLTINDEQYDNVPVRSYLTPQVGDVVFVEIPCNSMKDMFVDFIIT